MKSSTDVWIAIRNVGDNKDPGKTFAGTLNESLMWAIQQLAGISMAERIVIGIGRDEAGAKRAIASTSRGGNIAGKFDQDTIARVFGQFGVDDDDSEDEPELAAPAPAWTPPKSWA